MPLYEYRCEPCQLTFDKVNTFARCKEPAPCPKCGAEAARKISLPSPAIVPGGTFAQKSGMQTLKDFPDHNDWIDA